MRSAIPFFMFVIFLLVPEAKSFAPQEWAASAQSRSMGMATTAFADDHTALYVNPAGLAKVREVEWRLPTLFNAGLGRNLLDFVEQIQNLDTGGDTTIAQQLQTFDGTAVGLDLHLLEAYWVKERFALGFNPLNINGSFRLKSPSLLFAQLDVFYAIQGGIAVGYGHPFYNNRLRIGFTWKPVMWRSGLQTRLENQSIATLTDDFASLIGTGIGTDLDFGLQTEFVLGQLASGATIRWHGGLAWQNLLATNFPLLLNPNARNPPRIPRRLNIGTALRLENEGIIEPLLSIELRDLTTGYDEFLEKFHVALQLKFEPRSFYTYYIRTHLAKGNLGGGLGFEWNVFEIEAGTYAENLGIGPGLGVDRRYYMQGTLSF